MPNNKTVAVLVVCVGVVVSVWLFAKKPGGVLQTTQSANEITVISPREIVENKNDDWKKILTNVSNESGGSLTVLSSANSTSTFDDTTQTAQMARDFFSQYLLAKKGNVSLTSDQMSEVVQNTLSSQDYTRVVGAVYVQTNLRITPNKDGTTVQNYKEAVNASLKNRSMQVKDNLVSVLTTAVQSESAGAIARLDPIITANKAMINDFLNIEVPGDAVSLHLNLLNALSNILADLQAARETLVDPVRGLAGMSQYNNDLSNFTAALNNLNAYFVQRLGSSQ